MKEAGDSDRVLSAGDIPDVHWDDVIVNEKTKKDLEYFIDYLKAPKDFKRKGAAVPKGLLMVGPPGTGKTTLAKVVAAESGVTFLETSADRFESKWVGEGPERVHDMFAIARKYAPAILFIDEIDAIGRKRDASDSHHTADVLNALLTELDGFKTAVKKPVFVMAATNLGGRNGNTGVMDSALVRRFDNTVDVDLPDKESRIKIFELYIKKNPLVEVDDDYIKNLADRSVGLSPSNIKGIIDMAVRDAIQADTKAGSDLVDMAFERYMQGDEKKWEKDELLRTARHETGHAIAALKYGERPSYITIVSRGDHGGYMQHESKENKRSYTREELLQRIAVALGGRAAEIVYYGEEDGLTTGPSSDLENATSIASSMICRYGMYAEVGLSACISYNEGATDAFASLGEEIKIKIRAQINIILKEQLDVAVSIITSEKSKADRLVDALLERQHLTGDEIKEVFDQSP